jgi:hypothetical protein
MATIRAYTTIEQSRKLAEILPLESADMHYNNASIKGINYVDEHRAELMEYNRAIKVLSKYTINPLFEVIPCWSLAALLNILPETIEDEYGEYDLEINMIYKKPEYVRICDCHHSDFPSWEWDDTKELLDNIVEAVIWLNNNGYLRDEKLH